MQVRVDVSRFVHGQLEDTNNPVQQDDVIQLGSGHFSCCPEAVVEVTDNELSVLAC